MTKTEFIEELIDILDLDDDVTPETTIALDSLSIMSVIAFLDENFSQKATADELKDVSSIHDIMLLAGEEKIQ